MADKASFEIVATRPEYMRSFRRTLDSVARERRFLTLLEAPPLEETEGFVRQFFENNWPHFVALDGGEVVGWCDIRRHFFVAHAHRGTLGMGLLAAHRRKGLGLRLIQMALVRAERLGFVRVELDVHADNAPAIALYEKVGFIREGVMRNAFFADGAYRDAIAMSIIYEGNKE